MPKSDKFITRVSRNAVLTATAGSVIGAGITSRTMENPVFALGDQTRYNIQEYTPPEVDNLSEFSGQITNRFVDDPRIDEWTNRLEKEFRALVLEDAKGTINPEQQRRLEELTAVRWQLKSPRSEEEILLELRRDRVMANLSKALEEYVEFTKAASKI